MLGFGTAGLNGWQANGPEVVETMLTAMDCGYRHFDTSPVYGNEQSIGLAIDQSPVPRDELFITSKVSVLDFGFEQALAAFERSLDALKLDYIDLYILHWPVINQYQETWKALEKLYLNDRVGGIGVSNFHIKQLEVLKKFHEIRPACNQLEIHPYFSQKNLRQYCENNDIKVVSWSPLGVAQWAATGSKETPFKDPSILQIAACHNLSPAQIILRWHLQSGLISIPKTETKAHIQQNFSIQHFELSQQEMVQIDALDRNTRFGAVPEGVELGE